MADKHLENANYQQNSATETLSLTPSVEEQKKPTQYTLTSNLTLGTPIMVSL